MNFDRTRIQFGEEVLAEKRREAKRKRGHAEETAGDPDRVSQREAQKTAV